jgi:predicted Zn-dependent peptidase
MTVPAVVTRTLDSGLRVLAAQRHGVPLVELRLRIPVGTPRAGDRAVNLLLAHVMLAGTAELDRLALAERIEDLGANLTVEVDADAFTVSGHVLAGCLPELLGLLAGVLVGARYPDDEMAAERVRLVQRLRMARSKASVQARETLHGHVFGAHPYGNLLPPAETLDAVTPEDLRRAHAARIVPAGATLILVGDLDTSAALLDAHRCLGGWRGDPPPGTTDLPPLPPLAGDVSLLVHRPESVQSSIRIGGRALRRDNPMFAALQVANLLYGGYFSSRLVRNIREDKGYTYSPRSSLDHGRAGSSLVVEADVATAVTAPALLEMWYELGRLSTLRPTDDDLADARQYATGTLAMSVATHAGFATTLCTLDGVGLDVDWLREHPARLAEVRAEDIYDIGVHVLAPCLLAVVVIGDATHTAAPLKAFGPWEVRG